MPADLFVYALVAAGLIFWLRNIMGTSHEDEPKRPGNLAGEPAKGGPPSLGDSNFVADDVPASQSDRIADLAKNPTNILAIDNKTAENGLIEIADRDRSFDIDVFLEGAQDAFVMIVEGFAKGDRELLESLLGEDVFNAFNAAIDEREKIENIQETEIHAVRNAEVIEAKLDYNKALVTIRFKADETSVTRDKTGKIIEGDPDKTTEMHDIWTFGRDIKSRDPRWFVFETRGDFDGDNDLIPDTH